MLHSGPKECREALVASEDLMAVENFTPATTINQCCDLIATSWTNTFRSNSAASWPTILEAIILYFTSAEAACP